MKKYIIYFVTVIMLISLTGCPHDIDDVQDLIINNNSDIELVFYRGYKSQTVLDTTLNIDYPWHNEVTDFYIIKPHSFKEVREVKSNLEYILSRGWYQYYIFDYDSIKTIPWEQIRDENIIALRVDFETWEDLEVCNFTITYS